jgi:uncharacterized HAD superfamily protein/adenine/guanine phosphoribosyltransferase-like PRPP-binding protein
MYNYRSYHDLSLTVWNAIPRLAEDIDLIVGVPRSGMVPAMMLALYMNMRATSLDMLLLGKVFSSGMYRMSENDDNSISQFKHILILDDTYCSGRAMEKVHKQVQESQVMQAYKGKVSYAAVYVTPGNEDKLDYAFEVCPLPRVFQWNIFNHSVNSQACFDIDGVVCRDPSPDENDDGEKYKAFIRTARHRIETIHPISQFVSSRLEKYRKETEEWLHRSGYEYGKLTLLDLPNKEARVRLGCHGSFKAGVYEKSPETLFYESEKRQALEIAQRTGKDVFCTENMTLYSIPKQVEKEQKQSFVKKTFLKLIKKASS